MTGNDTPVATGPVIDGLDKIVGAIEALAQSNRGENPAPTIFRVFPVNRTHVRLRVVRWIVSGDNAAPIPVTLQIGSAVVATAVLSLESPTLDLPLPITIERGVDVVAAGGEMTDSWLIAYPE